jgi:hypothetical protein
MGSVISVLITAIRSAAVFNPDVQAAPVCILWPDHDRQWTAAIPVLQAEMPELFVLGDYDPEKRVGPAIWLRCLLAGVIEEVELPRQQPPVFYLPGVSRQELRAVESCSDYLKPLVELQYRGCIWSQLNGKDWTVFAYLKSDQGGLGLDVARDSGTGQALKLALKPLLDQEIESLRGRRLDHDYFNTLLTSGDPVRDVLHWLDQGEGFRESRGESEWRAFVEICKSRLNFNPQKEGLLTGAARLANREGAWKAVWERFCEAPRRYSNIPVLLRKCQPPSDSLFWQMSDGSFDGWPQWNDDQEKNLRRELENLASVPAHEARRKLLELEKQHGRRRGLVWAELRQAPLALAIGHLACLAAKTRQGLAAGSVNDLAKGYQEHGWQADNAVVQALAQVKKPAELAAVSAAIRAVYLPWLENAARYLQQVVDGGSYPGGTVLTMPTAPPDKGVCLLFVDGLRFDVARRLAELLRQAGCQLEEHPCWVPLPSLTGTGKPAAAPIFGSYKIAEEGPGYAFEPISPYLLKKTIIENGWQVLDHTGNGNPEGNAWCEYGDLDHEGHNQGWKLARQLESLLLDIRDRITALLRAGWRQVQVVTDHGWLLLPGGLPKVELAACLAENKWGRCAVLKPGAETAEHLYPWFWNPDQQIALADGVSCFKKGQEYTHGGLSLQECLTLKLTVASQAKPSASTQVAFTGVRWVGLRCKVSISATTPSPRLDLRRQAGDAASSCVVKINEVVDGKASVVVEDADLEGRNATLMLLAEDGSVMAQMPTVIGGGNE